MKPTLRLLSLGAGVQSTTLALMAATGEFEDTLDGAIFADTGWEPAAVYKHLDWLRTQLPFPVHIVNNGDIRKNILARRNLIDENGSRFTAIPWFIVGNDGSHGQGRRQCSNEFKLRPIMWKVRELLSKGRKDRIPVGAAEMWIGISLDEATRMKDAVQQYMTNRWPLIERKMTREKCLAWMKHRGYPEPPKSACVGCPFHNNLMWVDMKKNAPEEFADAVAIDAALREGDARGMRGVEYMHAMRIPLEDAVAVTEDRMARKQELIDMQPNLFENECEGICGV